MRFDKKTGVQTGIGARPTAARMRATASIRNAISFATMNYLMVEKMKILQALILNADATQFAVGGTADDKIIVKYVVPAGQKKRNTGKESLKAAPDSNEDNSLTKFFIKYMLLMSAGGFQAPPVYMLADDNMNDDEFRWYEVRGLGIGTHLNNLGYVVITKSRCGNTKFYAWFVEQILVKFVQEIISFYKLPETSASWFQLDGEAVQLYPYFNERLCQLLKDNHIHVGKPPASTTAITQPCDVGCCFKGPKTQAKKINKHSVKTNTFMLQRLTDLFKQHNAWLNSDERSAEVRAQGRKKKRLCKNDNKDTIEMNASHVAYAKFGLLRVQMALQLCMKQTMIRESFAKSGIFPFNLDVILTNFSKCQKNLTTNDLLSIKRSLPELATVMEEQGELPEARLSALGIKSSEETWRKNKSPDDLVLSRRRGVIITNEALQQKERAKLPAHAIIATPPNEDEEEEAHDEGAAALVDIVPPVIVPPVIDTIVPAAAAVAATPAEEPLTGCGRKRRACAAPEAIKAKLNKRDK